MSVEKYYVDREFVFVPVCDLCGDELSEQEDFQSAVDTKKRYGWKSRKDDNGEWMDLCPECQKFYPKKRRSAADDFKGIT